MRASRTILFLALSLSLAYALLASENSRVPQANVSALTNKDVLEMLKVGLSQEVVIAKIKSSNCAFDTSPDALKALKAANVPDGVILEMVRAPLTVGEKNSTNFVLPPLDQILEKYVQALGGKETIEKKTTRVIKGSFEYQGKQGTSNGYWKAPNKFGTVTDSAEFGRAREGFDGSVAWADSPQTGLREKSGQELSMAKRYSDFYYPLHLRELYPKMILKGEQKVGERRTYLVEADPGDGSLVRMYFDAETGLVARTDTESDTPQGRMTNTWYFDDYREIDGMKVAFSRRRPNASGDYVLHVREVLDDVPIDDAIFSKPTVSAKTQSLSALNSALTPSTLRAVAWRGVPWVTTSYYQQQGSANTDCTGSGTWLGNIWQGNSSCTTQYTPAQSIPINWQHYTIYNLVETSDSMMVLACTRNWAFSKCSYLIPGNIFQFENKKGKISIKGHKAGKDKEQTLDLDIVSSQPKTDR
jgi:hypothetical protein